MYISGWWFGTFGLFFHILGIVTPTDELIFFRWVGSTTNQIYIYILFIFIDYYSIAINPQGSNIHSSRNRFRIQVQAFHRNTNWTFPCDFTLTKPVTKKLGDTGEDLATAVFFFWCCFLLLSSCNVKFAILMKLYI